MGLWEKDVLGCFFWGRGGGGGKTLVLRFFGEKDEKVKIFLWKKM